MPFAKGISAKLSLQDFSSLFQFNNKFGRTHFSIFCKDYHICKEGQWCWCLQVSSLAILLLTYFHMAKVEAMHVRKRRREENGRTKERRVANWRKYRRQLALILEEVKREEVDERLLNCRTKELRGSTSCSRHRRVKAGQKCCGRWIVRLQLNGEICVKGPDSVVIGWAPGLIAALGHDIKGGGWMCVGERERCSIGDHSMPGHVYHLSSSFFCVWF